MPRGKQFVFSARTTPEGLEILNALKAKLGVSWDYLAIDALNAHYGVDVPKPSKATRKPKAERPKAEPKPKAAKKEKKAAKKTAKKQAGAGSTPKTLSLPEAGG